MFSNCIGKAVVMAVVAWCAMAECAAALPKGVLPFDASTWQSIKRELPRPAVVVFTTTDCTYCPGVIDELSAEFRNDKPRVAILVVVMDGAYKPAGWLAEPHYRKADRLYAFQGQETAIRFGIDRKWRGVTPYVALLGRTGEPQFVTGRPTQRQISLFRGR